MEISKEDFALWKDHPITQAYFEACAERIEDAKEILCRSAGMDNANDNFYRGFVTAYLEMIEFRVDEQEVV